MTSLPAVPENPIEEEILVLISEREMMCNGERFHPGDLITGAVPVSNLEAMLRNGAARYIPLNRAVLPRRRFVGGKEYVFCPLCRKQMEVPVHRLSEFYDDWFQAYNPETLHAAMLELKNAIERFGAAHSDCKP